MSSVVPAVDPVTGMERPKESFLSNRQLRAAGTLLAAVPLSACTNLSTRTHSVFHAQWARKENTLSLLTKHRQLAKSPPYWSELSEQLAADMAGKCGMPQKGGTGTGQPKEQQEGGTEEIVSPLLLRDWGDKCSFHGRIQIIGRHCG